MTLTNLSKSNLLRLLKRSDKQGCERLAPLPTVRDLIKLYRLTALKNLSQNFLLDPRVTDKIVKSAGPITHAEVCEVGPGPGSLTRSIMKRNPKRIVVIEKDARFVPGLEMLAESSCVPLDIVIGDVLTADLGRVFSERLLRGWSESQPDIHIIANLPFNVSTPLLIRWIKSISERKSAWRYGRVCVVVTLQKEVAERVSAPIMTKMRSRLSVMCQNWCHVQHLFNIPGSAFVPRPQVDVGVVRLEPLIVPVVDLPFPLVEKVTKAIFTFRQKYCIRCVEQLFPKEEGELAAVCLRNAQVEPTRRAFQLTLTDIGRICYSYQQQVSLNKLE